MEFRGNSVAIKRLKAVTASEAMPKFTKEVAMLDTFQCYNIVHFD